MGKKRGQKGQQRTLRHAPPARSVRQVEQPLLVFISSAIVSMEEERDVVQEAVESIQITRAWRFEKTPASSESAEDAYLSKVRSCDLFILVIGTLDRPAVRREYQVALETKRPILAFVEKAQRPPALDELVGSVGCKYRAYSSLAELKSAVRASVADEITRGHRKAVAPANVPGLVKALAPKGTASHVQDILGYVAFGVEPGSPSRAVFALFGGECVAAEALLSEPEWDGIVFDNPSEMKDVLQSLNRVTAIKKKASTGRTAPAFLEAWQNEVLRRASRHMVRRMRGGTATRAQPMAGLQYVVLGMHRDYAPLVRLMRPQEMMPDPEVTQRVGEELVFRSIDAVQKMFAVFQEAQQGSCADPEEWLSIVLEGAMRARLPSTAALLGNASSTT